MLTAVCLVLAVASSAAAQSSIFVVRHAERTDTPVPGGPPPKPNPPGQPVDPDLSEAGRARAESLAFALKDAGVTAIFVTPFKRTQQTAAPLAKALGLKPIVIDPDAMPTLLQQLAKHQGNALVVGHSNTVPQIVQGLGIKEPVTVADTEFDHLFVVTRSIKGSQTLVRLRYR